MDPKLKQELDSFKQVWRGGYKTGYDARRNQHGVEDYLRLNLPKNTTVLEIGCGGGQWSKFIAELGVVNKLYAIDALSAEHNDFWNFVGHDKKSLIEYVHVQDFSLKDIPDNSLDYVFSYDVFCHISYSGQRQYLENLRKKCKPGAILFIMYADPAKYLSSEPKNMWHVKDFIPGGQARQYASTQDLIDAALADCDGDASRPRWFWVGKKRFIETCRDLGYYVAAFDLNIDRTNVITLFINA